MQAQKDNLHIALRKAREQLRYNTLCAPDYPEEDRTDLDREAQEILNVIAILRQLAESSARTMMVDAAARDTHAAFEHYVRGHPGNGRRLLESVLEHLAYYEADKLPETGFIVASDGTTTSTPKAHH